MMLVVSSLLRLDLYVAAYSLTYLRVAAFLWMGLVGLGLGLLILKIYGHKGNAWLIGANALTTGVTLYVCCFANFPLLIANYNIAHASPDCVAGQHKLDENYLVGLGAQAIPALDTHIEACRNRGRDVKKLEDARASLAGDFKNKHEDWRGFGLESWKLERYLDGKAQAEAKRPADDRAY